MSRDDLATIFLRLEGPLQAWGDSSRFTVRRTRAEPTRSGVAGLLCCALGWPREHSLDGLAPLRMGVRVDRPGHLIRDYHTVGAKVGCMSAEGKVKRTGSTGEVETHVTTRFLLADASFLAALLGPDALVGRLAAALRDPVWPPYLGRKACPPSAPLLAGCGRFPDPLAALRSVPWRPRLAASDLPETDRRCADTPPSELRCVVECDPAHPSAEARPDLPLSFKPRRFGMRFVREELVQVPEADPTQKPAPRFQRPRQRYQGPGWKERRRARAERDNYLCVFCRLPSSPVHHVTYARANEERIEDLRSMCRLCHDAVTMLETERGMAEARIDPLRPEYRELIRRKRADILRYRQPT